MLSVYDKKIEVLAPVGSIESFYAAINSGANAIYLGVGNFNARAKCDDFTLDNIAKFIDYAHVFSVKVYITLNTLIADGEIDEFIKTAVTLYDLGADAFIIQDIGMAALIHKILPNAKLHASTQMGIHNLQGAIVMEKLGFSRVVLSRETKLEDIKSIKDNTSLEIEFFVQGALCVAFSGNCYLSSVKDGNSGNRGKCRQLCRLLYSCGDKRGYLLSPADLSLVENVSSLIDAGVMSLKIEGRMKRPAYVATSVKLFRQIVDGDTRENVAKTAENLKKVFSRGEYNTSAYLHDNFDIINDRYNNNTGVLLGTVTAVERFKNLYKITISSSEKISEGDGLRILSKEEVSLGVGGVKTEGKCLYSFVTAKNGILAGARVYRVLDVCLEDRLLPKTRKIAVDVKAVALVGKPFELTLSVNDTFVIESGDVVTKAQTAALDEEELKKRIKFDDLPFVIGKTALVTDGAFVPVSMINAVRRKAVTRLYGALTDAFKPTPALNYKTTLAKEKERYEDALKKAPDYNYVLSDDISDLISSDCDNVVFAPKDYKNMPKIDLYKAFSTKNFYLYLPVIASGKDMEVIFSALDTLDLSYGKNVGVVANNYYGLQFLGSRPTVIGTGLNVYNKISGAFYLDIGAKDVVFSCELTSAHNFAAYVGNAPLMTFTHCPYKVALNSVCSDCKGDRPLTYTDERGNEYLIARYKLHFC